MAQRSNQSIPDNQSEVFAHVVEILSSMFGQVMTKDALEAIVESFDCNLHQSIEAVMHIVNDGSESTHLSEDLPKVSEATAVITNPNVKMNIAPSTPSNTPNTMSYAAASNKPGTMSTFLGSLPQRCQAKTKKFDWNKKFQKIMDYHSRGFRILILLRGPTGCGKTYLGHKILELTVGSEGNNLNTHICSTDDFFIHNKRYIFNKEKLSDAHAWNQSRVRNLVQQGVSPIIIDNTNIYKWEMLPYVRDAVKEGYLIEVVTPDTPWAKNAYKLFQKNVHGVRLETIKRMLERFEDVKSGEQLIKDLNISYPHERQPPVLRVSPAINYVNDTLNNSVNEAFPILENCVIDDNVASISQQSIPIPQMETLINQDNSSKTQQSQNQNPLLPNQYVSSIPEGTLFLSKDTLDTNASPLLNIHNSSQTENITKIQGENENVLNNMYYQVAKQLEEYQKIEYEWEMGEKWNEDHKAKINTVDKPTEEPKLQRNLKNKNSDYEIQLLGNINDNQDWRSITSSMLSLDEPKPSTSNKHDTIFIDSRETGTCMELGDTDINDSKYKVVSVSPRDINFDYMPQEETIPEKRMLDKSSMTNEQPLTKVYRCINEEKHFVAFCKMFKNISKSDLREIFDRCCGDVNWAVSLVVDGVTSNCIETVNDEASDSDDNGQEQCDCVATYNVIPNVVSSEHKLISLDTNMPSTSFQKQKKVKKDKVVSESSMQIKKLIEQNVVISDNHYSEHGLKIRNLRHGDRESNTENISSQPVEETLCCNNLEGSDSESVSSQDSVEKTVNVNLGNDFVIQLDNLFGRSNLDYPPNITPIISMPLSTLNEINALWIESLTNQIASQQEYSNILIKQDEEIARKLAEKEAELIRAGMEPEVPDLKEIMDMDFALNIYQKDVKECLNNEPKDLAAKLTREKLKNLFPEIPPESLFEVFMAHNNNFQATLETLLQSTGQAQILEQKNGINKFVMEREMARQVKLMEDEKQKALVDEEWPILAKTDTIDMAAVHGYRQQAKRHLDMRNVYLQKAQDYIGRGMTQVATYYSDIASFHKNRFEQSNSLAASSLIHVNSKDRSNTTLDLHYMYVTEALQTLDLFIDHHIQLLRNDKSNRPQCNSLFFITGRGLHSPSGPRVKPAVRRRLKKRGFSISELNPGLLTIEIRSEHKLTHQLS